MSKCEVCWKHRARYITLSGVKVCGYCTVDFTSVKHLPEIIAPKLEFHHEVVTGKMTLCE